MKEGGSVHRQFAQSSRMAVNHEDVRRYYCGTWYDFRGLWMNKRNRAMHFGYWDDTVTSHASALERMNEVLADRASISPDDRCIDAGCGVGGTAMWIAERIGARVEGVTIVPEQAERARRYASERNLSELVEFVEADFADLPYDDRTFDVAYAQEAFCHAPNKDAVLRELARVLKPGGRLVIGDYVRVPGGWSRSDHRLFNDVLVGWKIPDVLTEDELRSAAADAGFTDLVVTNVAVAVWPSLRRLGRLSSFGLPLETLLHWVGLRSAIQHGNVLGARGLARTARRGRWFYGIFSAARQPEVVDLRAVTNASDDTLAQGSVRDAGVALRSSFQRTGADGTATAVKPFDIVVVGSGQAGASEAWRAASEGLTSR